MKFGQRTQELVHTDRQCETYIPQTLIAVPNCSLIRCKSLNKTIKQFLPVKNFEWTPFIWVGRTSDMKLNVGINLAATFDIMNIYASLIWAILVSSKMKSKGFSSSHCLWGVTLDKFTRNLKSFTCNKFIITHFIATDQFIIIISFEPFAYKK